MRAHGFTQPALYHYFSSIFTRSDLPSERDLPEQAAEKLTLSIAILARAHFFNAALRLRTTMFSDFLV